MVRPSEKSFDGAKLKGRSDSPMAVSEKIRIDFNHEFQVMPAVHAPSLMLTFATIFKISSGAHYGQSL
jgi:hypothetical protein